LRIYQLAGPSQTMLRFAPPKTGSLAIVRVAPLVWAGCAATRSPAAIDRSACAVWQVGDPFTAAALLTPG
jgi:hypothetical protein